MQNKLVTIVLLLLTLVYAVFVIGAVVVWYDEPDRGDVYFLLYGVIALALSIVAAGRRLFSAKGFVYSSVFSQALVVILILVMAALGLFAASALVININEPGKGYNLAAIICIFGVLVCGGIIWGVGKRPFRRRL